MTSGRPKFLSASPEEPRPPPLLGGNGAERGRAGSRARRGRAGTEKAPSRARRGRGRAEEGPSPPGRPLRGRAPPGRALPGAPSAPAGPAEGSGAAWPRPGGGLPRARSYLRGPPGPAGGGRAWGEPERPPPPPPRPSPPQGSGAGGIATAAGPRGTGRVGGLRP